jgi:hypothetical protein
LTEGEELLAEIVPGGVIPAVLARLAPLVQRAITEASRSSTVTADAVVVRDHRSAAGTRLAAENAEAFDRR